MQVVLNDKTLLKDRAFIDGEFVSTHQRFAVNNPANGVTITQVADCGVEETRAAIAAAKQAQKSWAAKPAKDRAKILRRFADLMVEHQEDLARIMTAEQGKPLVEARGEVVYAASFIEFFAEEAKRVNGEVLQSPWADKRVMTLRQPLGVGAGITPWNFPSAMITRKAAPALAVGCAMVIKPAEATPLSALALAEISLRAELPPGVLNIVTAATPGLVGDELCANPDVRGLSFTGSTAVGKMLLGKLAKGVKKASMELGGNAPFIVFDDADVDQAVTGAMLSKYRNAGQTCVCANRFLIQDKIYDMFMDKFKAKVAAMKVGNGVNEGVEIGPLINFKAIDKVRSLVDQALSMGAVASVGGRDHEAGQQFYTPTVLEKVSLGMDVVNQEIFGPVAPILRFKDEKEAIEIANNTPYGLAAYFYSRDLARCWRVGEALEYGIVGVNTGIFSSELAPFGGVKESGLGREGSSHGVDEWVELKYLALGGM